MKTLYLNYEKRICWSKRSSKLNGSIDSDEEDLDFPEGDDEGVVEVKEDDKQVAEPEASSETTESLVTYNDYDVKNESTTEQTKYREFQHRT